MFTENQVKHLFDNGTKPLSSIENSLIPAIKGKNDYVQSHTLLRWCQMVVQPYNIKIDNFTTSWKSGLAFCAIIHRFKGDLM